MIDIIPGIGIAEQSWKEIEEKLHLVEPYVAWVQIDIADGTLVPRETVNDFSNYASTKISLEAHLMVADPVKYIRPLVDVGFKRLIAHIESDDPRKFLDEAKYESVEVGFAIDGPTELEQIEPMLDSIDVVQVMTIEAGDSGKPFLPETVEKIKRIHENYPNLPIEVDGGIDEIKAKIVAQAGATRIVSTTYLFKDPQHIAHAIERLKGV